MTIDENNFDITVTFLRLFQVAFVVFNYSFHINKITDVSIFAISSALNEQLMATHSHIRDWIEHKIEQMWRFFRCLIDVKNDAKTFRGQ